MASTKVIFSLDEETVRRLRQVAESLHRPQSQIVREAIEDYAARVGQLREAERQRLLRSFDELVPLIPSRPLSEVEAELFALCRARQAGGRRTG